MDLADEPQPRGDGRRLRPGRTGLRQLTPDGHVGAPSWTAGGSQILYTVIVDRSNGTGAPSVYVMDPDGSNPKAVASYGDCCRWYPIQQPTP